MASVTSLKFINSDEGKLFLKTFEGHLSVKFGNSKTCYDIDFTKEVEDFIKKNFETWKIRVYNDKYDYFASDKFNISPLAFCNYKKYGEDFKESINKIIKFEDYYNSDETNGKIFGSEWNSIVEYIIERVNSGAIQDYGKLKSVLDFKCFEVNDRYVAEISVFDKKV